MPVCQCNQGRLPCNCKPRTLREHCKQAAAEVATWPKWKQRAMDGFLRAMKDRYGEE